MKTPTKKQIALDLFRLIGLLLVAPFVLAFYALFFVFAIVVGGQMKFVPGRTFSVRFR